MTDRDRSSRNLQSPELPRDQEDRSAVDVSGVKEKNHDKTLADSFPTSDPPSTIPDPASDSFGDLPEVTAEEELLQDLTPGSWAAVSLDRKRILGVGRTSEEAAQIAHRHGNSQVVLVQVPRDPDAPLQAA